MKIITLGSSNVGKSSFIKKILTNEFSSCAIPTIGVDYSKKKYKGYTFDIWDTAGQEYFNAVSSQYYKNTDVCLVFFDLTSEESFNCLDNKMIDFFKYNNKKSLIFLIGNKKDLIKEISFPNKIKDFCQKYQATYYEISCKNDDILFFLDEIINFKPFVEIELDTVKLIEKPVSKKNKCC